MSTSSPAPSQGVAGVNGATDAAPVPETGPMPALGVMPRRIGASGLRVHPVALGANVFGWSVDDGAARRILDAFVDGGGTTSTPRIRTRVAAARR